MNDTIRKAIELADGVYLDEYSHLIGMGSAVFIDDLQQYHLDSLAAQLVRQVDALDRIHVSTIPAGSEIWERVEADDGGWDGVQNLGSAQGPDRTLNTIKAIVDSGVLE